MNKKLQNLSLSLLIALLFAILFQSVHSYEHLAKQFTEAHCDHQYTTSKTELSHSHHDFDDCFVCEFSFNNAVPLAFLSFNFFNTSVTGSLPITAHEKPFVFSADFFSLRAPPCFIG